MYEFGFRCDTGRVRDINQDAFFVIPEKGVFLIADGVGGHNNGELASRTAMTDIAEYIKENPILNRSMKKSTLQSGATNMY